MKIYEGNLITPIEDYQGKWALSPCGNFTDNDFNGKEGWFIVEPLLEGDKYLNGELIYNIDKPKENKIKQLKNLATETILDRYPQYKQINASLGIYTAEYKAEMINFISSVINIVDGIEQQINAMTREELFSFNISADILTV